MFNRLIGWITGRTERLRGIERRSIQRSDSMLIMGEFRKLQDLINLQSRLDARRYAVEFKSRAIVTGYLKVLVKRAEEDALGPMVYDISAGDLDALSAEDSRVVFGTGVRYFNDITAVGVYGVPGCYRESVDRIMQWKKDCVSRITQEQVVEALDVKEGNGTGGRMNLHTKAGRELHGDK